MGRTLTCQLHLKQIPDKYIEPTIDEKDLEKQEADAICAKISLTLQNSKPPNNNLSEDEHKTLKELQSDS